MDRKNGGRAPACKSGHPGDEISKYVAKTCKGTVPCLTYTDRGEEGSTMSHEEGGHSLLWRMYVSRLLSPFHGVVSTLGS